MRAWVLASDAKQLKALSARLENHGVKVAVALEGLALPTWAIDLDSDLILVHVEPGEEMAAYYIGRTASERGVATLFAAAQAEALAIDALVHAIPHSVLIEYPFSDEVLLAKIEQALSAA